ncbi:MAG: SGNH/GDSL hydrolase family protein [Clostridia bacterium]|nr:SGNH/GDSL hydrolase family protein [Clostridia bacterium]
MKMKNKSQYLYVLRNLLLFFLVLAVTVIAIEKVLAVKNAPVEDLQSIEEENYRILLMNTEGTKISPATKKALQEHFGVSNKVIRGLENQNDYPLNDMHSDDIFDVDEAINIVVVGDSFVWGAGCTNRNELFWNILELSLRNQGYKCNVFGVGFGGASSVDELSWVRDTSLIEDLNPDIVIIGYVYNDAEDLSSAQKTEVIPFDFALSSSSFMNKYFPNITDSFVNFIRAKTMYNGKYGSSYYDGITTLTDEVFAEYEKQFLQPLDEFAKNTDFPVVLMTLPGEPNKVFYSEHYAPFYANMNKYENVAFYDCSKALYTDLSGSEHRNNYHINSVNGHPGTATNRFYSDYIEDFLKKDFNYILGEPTIQYEAPFRINDYLPYNISLNLLSKTEDELIYSLTYPSEKKNYQIFEQHIFSYFLNYPIGDNYIKLSFESPVDIADVEILCDSASGIELYYTGYNNKLGYDDHIYSLFGKKKENSFLWEDTKKEKVSSLCICADTKDGKEAEIQIRIKKAK